MKNKVNNDFHQFRVKIFLCIIAMLGIAAATIYIMFSVLLRGNFANLMMSLLQNSFGMDYDTALDLYSRVFRSHMDMIILLSILLVFIGLLYVFLRWITGYFEEISKGMDALLQDTAGEISLSPELLSIERKMNIAKHMQSFLRQNKSSLYSYTRTSETRTVEDDDPETEVRHEVA